MIASRAGLVFDPHRDPSKAMFHVASLPMRLRDHKQGIERRSVRMSGDDCEQSYYYIRDLANAQGYVLPKPPTARINLPF